MDFELSSGRQQGAGRLLIGDGTAGSCRRDTTRRAPRTSSRPCASITANAAVHVLGAPPAAALAAEAQHSLLVAAAAAHKLLVVARGSTLQLRHHRRRKPVAKAAAPAPTAVSVPAAAAPSPAAAPATGGRSLQQFLAGGAAGAVSKTLVAPLERISTILMADAKRFASTGAAARHAWEDGLYRGHAATLIKIFPASAIQFAVFNGLKDRLLAGKQQRCLADAAAAGAAAAGGAGAAARHPRRRQQPELANHERLLAGAAAGAAAACACYPLESMRTMMSVAGGVRGSLLQVGRQVVAAHGLGALYKGFRASLIGDVLGNSLGFTAYEIGNRIYRDMHGGAAPPPHLRGVIGACSAACVMTLTMPLEVVRRRLQIQGLAGRPVLYRGTLDCLRQVLRAEGVAGFFRASLPCYLKVAPSIGCMYMLYEVFSTQLAERAHPARARRSSKVGPPAASPQRASWAGAGSRPLASDPTPSAPRAAPAAATARLPCAASP